ncbi:hypothetical protein EVAR_78917_1 [Eumeta japonica]|uniref:Uncharacterized protein n=1 Tax=Eumeta variegata TaxID=151549 RepID=A0A4C1U2Q9_EUMVA|nr:hypothetical protein EVAR_78917_1 [Eumeta japonica]
MSVVVTVPSRLHFNKLKCGDISFGAVVYIRDFNKLRVVTKICRPVRGAARSAAHGGLARSWGFHTLVCGCRFGTEALPHARASSRRGYDPDGSSGNGYINHCFEIMPAPSPHRPRARAVIAHAQSAGGGASGDWSVIDEGGRRRSSLHTQPTAGGRTLVDADRIKAARIGDPLGVDLTERACRPLIRLSTHPPAAAGTVRVSEPRPSTSSFFDLERSSSFFTLRTSIRCLRRATRGRARYCACAQRRVGGALGCGVVVDEGGEGGTAQPRTRQRAGVLFFSLRPSSGWSIRSAGGPPKHRFTIRVIVPTMSGQAPRRLQHGRRAASDTSASGKPWGQPYQCTLHVRGGRGAEPPAF